MKEDPINAVQIGLQIIVLVKILSNNVNLKRSKYEKSGDSSIKEDHISKIVNIKKISRLNFGMKNKSSCFTHNRKINKS